MFWILVSLLLLIAAAILSFRLWRKPAPPAMEEGVDALNVLRDQRNELDEEAAAGRVNAAEREARIADLTRRVHDEGLTAPATPVAAAYPKRRLWLAVAVTILIPALAVPVYFLVGTPAALDPVARAPAAANSPHGDGEFTPERLRAMLDQIKARLDAKPDDVPGWIMLGRGLQLVNDFAGSAAAFEKAAALRPDDASLLADYADSLAMSRNKDLTGKPWELIQQALRIDPRWPKALALAASAEYAQRRLESAKGYWVRLLAVLPPDSEDAAGVRTMIAQVDGQASGAAPQGATAAATPAATAGGAVPSVVGKVVTGTVRLAPALAAKVKADDVVFVFARAPEGSRMPLAIVRLKASELPKQFRLDDTQAMAGAPTLSSMPQVRIEVRVSKSGDVRPSPGDLRGESALVAPGATDVEIVINEEITGVPGSAATGAPPVPAVSARPPAAATANGKPITGIVRLAPALAAKVAPDDTLFIFARAAEGSRMPLAILRLKASELPKQFRLDDSLGMTGGPALSSVPQIRIEARISKSGDAIPKPGDLRGESAVVAPGAGNVEVVIDRSVP